MYGKQNEREVKAAGLSRLGRHSEPVPHIFEMPTLSGAQNIDAIKIVSLICDTLVQ